MTLLFRLKRILFRSIVFILAISFLTTLSFDTLAQTSLDKRELDFETKLGYITLMSGDSMTIRDKKPTFDRQKAICKAKFGFSPAINKF